jgi:ribonuclease VapC
MIVIDSSALVAIFLQEAEHQPFENIIAAEERRLMSALNAHETACVLRIRIGPEAVEKFWRLLEDSQIEFVAFDYAQVQAAALAFARYGKGIDPKARLNLADCAAYALAKTLDVPLLFKGNDFAQTDIKSAL